MKRKRSKSIQATKKIKPIVKEENRLGEDRADNALIRKTRMKQQKQIILTMIYTVRSG